MPTDSAHPSLAELLTSRARRASDLRLALDVAVGIVAVGVAAIWRPAGWLMLAAAGLCVGAFGAWGITDRELRERAEGTTVARSLRVARRLAVALGTLAAVALLLTLCALALGTWIS
jgi:hypothetical protein